MDDAATHIPALALAIHMYGRRVLEIGGGWYSTPLIYALCPQTWVRTLEESPKWVSDLKPFAGPMIFHSNNIVDDAWDMRRTGNHFDVVFIDNFRGEDRVRIAAFFLNDPVCIVAHDTERDYWLPILEQAKFQRHFDKLTPRTSYLSNVLDVREKS